MPILSHQSTPLRMAAFLEAAAAEYGDLPVVQNDHDSHTNLPTRRDAVSLDEEAGFGPVCVIGNDGYDYGVLPGDLTALDLARVLRAFAAEHGDLPLFHRDADTRQLLRYDDVHVPEVDDGRIVIDSTGYTDQIDPAETTTIGYTLTVTRAADGATRTLGSEITRSDDGVYELWLRVTVGAKAAGLDGPTLFGTPDDGGEYLLDLRLDDGTAIDVSSFETVAQAMASLDD